MAKVDLQALLNQSLTGTNTVIPPTIDEIDPLNMEGDELLAAIDQMPGPKIPGVEKPVENPFDTENPYTNFMQNQWDQFNATAPGAAYNPLAPGKEELFGSGADHHFYERYYEHPKFDKLGFTPFRDNESFYNENSTAWDDSRRMMGEWAALTWLGLKDAFSFGAQSDTEMAKDFQRYMGIGSSTRGGMTQFTNNLFLNSGYTFGIIAELALEEVALALATGASLGTAAPVTVTAMGARGTRAMMKIKKGWDVTRKMMKTLDNLQDVSKARKYFNTVKNSTGRFLNPLSSTTAYLKNVNKLDNMNGMAKATLGFGSFYRDVRNIRLAWGESALEGGMVENQMTSELLAEFEAEHGRAPTDQEALELKNTAIAAGSSAAWQNLPTIFFSNKIVFDNMFKTFSPIRRLTDDVIEMGAAGKIRFNKNLAKDAFDVGKKGWKGFIQSAKNPKAYARNGANYFKANFAEGGQEIAQEVIAGATMDLYKNRGSNASIFGGGYMSALGTNMNHMMSLEGLEIFGSGFLMGGLVQGPQKVMGMAKNQAQRLKDPAKYMEMKKAREEQLNRTVNTLNEFYNDPNKFLAPDMENAMAQYEISKGMDQASEAHDEKTFHDLRTASHFQHVMTALQMGRMETFIDRMESQKDLSEEEIMQMPGVTSVEAFNATIDKSVARAKNIKARFEVINKKLPNPINVNQYKFGSPEYVAAVEAKHAWTRAQSDAIFMGHSFDRSLERMNDILGTAKETSNLKNIPVGEFNKLFNLEDIEKEIQQLDRELEMMGEEEGTLPKEHKKLRKDRESSRDLLRAYQDAMSEFVSVGTTTQDVQGAEMSQEGKDKLHGAATAFEKYIKHLGKKHKQPIFEDELADTFQKIVDYFQLEDDSVRLTAAVNTLMDPKNFRKQVSTIAEIQAYNKANKKEKIRKLLEEYEKARVDNDLMNELYEAGMFFDPAQYQALIKDGIMPDNFYDINTLDEIQRGTAKYTQALDIVKKYMEVTGKEIPEAEWETDFQPYSREKINEDRRTYKDLAEQFGFDPEAQSSEVSAKKVFETIIDSPYATKREKAIAREYLKRTKPDHIVKFVNNNAKPGHYDGNVVVDARYNSHDYAAGRKGHPIEHVILHEESHRFTVEALATDEEYNNSITELREKALARYEEMEPGEGFVTKPDKPHYGLMNNAEFVAEAMTNTYFQRFLASISHEHKAENRTVWDGFVSSILRMMKMVFGKKNTSGTVLNAAIDLITAQIGPAEKAMTKLEYQQAKEKIETDRAQELDALDVVPVEEGAEEEEAPEEIEGDRLYPEAPLPGEEWESATKEYTITGVTEDTVFTLVDGKDKEIPKEVWVSQFKEGKINKFVPEVEETPEAAVPQEDIDAVNKKYDKKITALDKRYEDSQKEALDAKAEQEAKEGVPVITRNTPIERMPDVLAERLIEAFIQKNNIMETINDEDPLLFNWANMSHPQISKTKEFRSWVKDAAFSEPNKIIQDFLGPAKKSAKAKGAIKTQQMKRDLIALGGYAEEDYLAMSIEEINNAIVSGLSKEGAEALQIAEEGQVQANIEELVEEAKEDIINVISTAANMEEFAEAKKFAHMHLIKHTILLDDDLTTEWVDELLAAKLQDLAFSFTAKDIKTGMTIQMKNGAKMNVVNADPKNKTILLEHPKSKKSSRIRRDKVQERVQYVYNPLMKEPEVAKEMAADKASPEAIVNSAESVKTNKDISDTAADDAEIGKKAAETDEGIEALKAKMKKTIKKNCG